MTDAIPILNATRLGYEILSDSNNDAWFRIKGGKEVGPFKTLEEASYAAIQDHEDRKITKIISTMSGEPTQDP